MTTTEPTTSRDKMVELARWLQRWYDRTSVTGFLLGVAGSICCWAHVAAVWDAWPDAQAVPAAAKVAGAVGTVAAAVGLTLMFTASLLWRARVRAWAAAD